MTDLRILNNVRDPDIIWVDARTPAGRGFIKSIFGGCGINNPVYRAPVSATHAAWCLEEHRADVVEVAQGEGLTIADLRKVAH